MKMVLRKEIPFLYLISSILYGLNECQYQYPWLNNQQPNWGNNDPRLSSRQQYPNWRAPWLNQPNSGSRTMPSASEQHQHNPRASSSQNNPNHNWPNKGGAREPYSGNYQASASEQNSRFFGSGVPNEFFGSKVALPTSDQTGKEDCGQDAYKNFVFSCLHNNASSLLEADMSFPTKLDEVKKSCSLWSSFFICIRQKIQTCRNHKQFTEGLKDPISSLQKICTDDEFQQKYLRQADCMRSVVQTYCLPAYNNLIARVKIQDVAIINYCCDGLVLKQCAMAPLKEQCSSLAEEILVSTLHFLSKCGQYRPPLPCPTVELPSSNPVPNPRNLNSGGGFFNRRNENMDANKNINPNIGNNRLGNGRLVDQGSPRVNWDSPSSTLWPINIQPAQQKDPKSSANVPGGSVALIWTMAAISYFKFSLSS